MKTIVLYKTDFNHSFVSRELIGIFTNKSVFKKEAKKIIVGDLQSDSGNMSPDEEKQNIKSILEFFFSKNQTQGLNEFELVAEEIKTNKII